ncbi:MAG: hypothetical protein WKG07_15600 [Hymenobacter sp.]
MMKNPISALSRLAVVLTGALALGPCSRAEYAFLPRSAGTWAPPRPCPGPAPRPPTARRRGAGARFCRCPRKSR